jgi:O-antigen/teichoic acid export membrane protein
MTGLKYAAARGVVWNLAQTAASRLLSLVVFVILARMIDRSAFGAVALATAVNGFGELLVSQGYGEFITQSPTLNQKHLDTAFWLNLAIGLVLTVVIAAGATPLAAAFAEPSVAPIVRWLSLSLFIRSLTVVPTALLGRELNFRTLTMRSIVAAAIAGAAGIIAALAGCGIYSLVIQLLVGDLAAAATLWGATHFRPRAEISREALRDLARYGAPIFGAGVLGFATRRVDILIILGSLGLSTLGVYTAAQRVFQIAQQVLNKSTESVAFSTLSRVVNVEERRRQAFYKVIEVTAALCFPAYAGLAIVSEPA